MSSEEKETLVKRLLVSNVSVRNIIWTIRNKFGTGISTTRILELKAALTPEEIDRIRSTFPPDPPHSTQPNLAFQKEITRQKQAIRQLL